MEQIINLKENIKRITSSTSLFKRIESINIDFSQENFLVFYLDSRFKLIDTEILFKGGLNQCLVDAKTLFRKAILNNSAGIILANNHTSGELIPTLEDSKIFEDLKKIGTFLGVDVLDCVIFNETNFFSLKDYIEDKI